MFSAVDRYNKTHYHDRFCNVPFRNMVLKSNGDVCFCSWSSMHVLGNIFKTPDIYNNIWNGDAARIFRESIFDGSFKYCGDYCCHLIEGTGPVQINGSANKLMNDYFTMGINSNEKRYIKDKSAFVKNPPMNLTLSTTSSCNLRCSSCRDLVSKDPKTKDEMDLYEARRMSLVADAETIFFGSYGEITVNELDTKMLFSYSSKELHNIKRIILQTNGILFTKEYWDKITFFIKKKISSIEISVDAATEATYRLNRRGGDWKKLWENIEFLSSLKYPWLQLNFLVQKNNYKEIVPFIDLAKKYNAAAHFQLIYNWGTYTDEEFKKIDILNPLHPEHKELIKLLLCKEFASKTVINDLALGKEFDDELLKYKRDERAEFSIPYIIYSGNVETSYNLMGSSDGSSLSIDDNFCENGSVSNVMKVHCDGNELWNGIFFLASGMFGLNDRNRSIKIKGASKLEAVMKASRELYLNEMGFGEITDSSNIRMKGVRLETEYKKYEFDLSGRNLDDINGLFFFSKTADLPWDIYIKEIIIY